MNVRELLDQHLPLGRDRLPLGILAGVWAALIGLPLFCCGGCLFLFPDTPVSQPSPAPARLQAMPTPLPPQLAADLDDEIDRVIDPATAPPAKRNPPVADASRLLAAAAASEKGEILLWERSEGLTVQVHSRKFCEPAGGPREAARWRAAIDSLHSLGLIEVARVTQGTGFRHSLFEYWRVTAAGYSVADSHSPADSGL